MRRNCRILAASLLLSLVLGLSGCGKSQQEQYDAARNLFYYGQYSEARKAFRALEDFSDSKAMVTACDYQMAMIQLSDEEYLGAAAAFSALGEYGNAKGLSRAAEALAALQQYENGDREGAIAALAGTRLAQDLGAGQSEGQELSGLVGTWSASLDILPEVKAELKELAEKQDELDKSFVDGLELKEMLVKVSLEVCEDGLAILSLGQEELDRVEKSFETQLHQGVTAYFDKVVDEMAEEEDSSREKLIENWGATDLESMFQSKTGVSFKEFERSVAPTKAYATLGALYNGSGVALLRADSPTLHFPEKTWTVDASKDGKLTISDETYSLTLTRIS